MSKIIKEILNKRCSYCKLPITTSFCLKVWNYEENYCSINCVENDKPNRFRKRANKRKWI
jgi:hypothetical protein